MTGILRIVLAAVVALTIAGCTESSLARRDTVTPFAYNTQASNIATQAVNPAEPKAFDRRIGLDGAYGAKAVASRQIHGANGPALAAAANTSPTTASFEPTTGGGTTQ